MTQLHHFERLMLIAIAQSRRTVAVSICFLLLASGSFAHSQVKEVQSCGKKGLVIFVHRDNAPVTGASPSGNDPLEFGTVGVTDFIIRTGLGNDSEPLGRARGCLTFEKDLSTFVVFTYELAIPGCTGSLTAQGTVDQLGNGEIVITGGTGAYRWALGYLGIERNLLLGSRDPAVFVFKDTIHLKYF